MKLKHVGMIVVSVLAMSSAAVSAAEGDESVTTTVNGGVIHFKGEVVNAACAIDSESMNQTVELGQVRSSRLAKAGDLSSAVGFNIKLNDCDTNFRTFWCLFFRYHAGQYDTCRWHPSQWAIG
ncbi:TPA: fimbrial protein [Escherichia coli]